MATPSQVLKDAEDAEKIWQEMYDKKPDDKPDDKSAEYRVDEPKPEDKEGEPKPDEKPIDKPDEKPAVEDKDKEKPKEETVDYWKHRFEVVEGKLKTEVPDLALRLNETLNKLRAVETELTGLKTGKTVETEKPIKVLEELENDPSVAFLKAEYPDVWKGIGAVVDKVVKSTREEIDKLSSELKKQGSEVAKTNRDRFYDDLDTIKTWEVINASPGFNAWLDQPDRYSGMSRRDLLSAAYARLDSNTVKNFFEDFLTESTPKKDNPPSDDGDKRKVEVDKGKKPVVDSPRDVGHKRPADKDQLQPTLIKASEISEFYMNVQKGVYKGREADMQRREAELDKAIAEGRVI